VIELASLHLFLSTKKHFWEHVSENIGIAINNLDKPQDAGRTSQKSQGLTEELQTQQGS